jgi:hypothetical protein
MPIKELENKLAIKQEKSIEAKPEDIPRELFEEKVDENYKITEENKQLQNRKSSLQALVKDQAVQIQDLHARLEI